MDCQQWDELLAAFDVVIHLSGDDQVAFLNRYASEHPELILELRSLVDAHLAADGFMHEPAIPQWRETMLRASSAEIPQYQIGDEIAGYRIERVLGSGGFGRVYLAHDVHLGRSVAVKVTPNRGHEARMMAGIEHDHIVTVYREDLSADGAHRIIGMQYVPGATLQEILQEIGRSADPAFFGQDVLSAIDRRVAGGVPFDPSGATKRAAVAGMDATEFALYLCEAMASALQAAHSRDVLHLDVKPANILFNAYGEPKLADFNVAWGVGESWRGYQSQLGGTMGFMAPEHRACFRAGSDAQRLLGPAADQFSLSKTLAAVGRIVDIPFVQPLIDRGSADAASDRFSSCDDFARACRNRQVQYQLQKRWPRSGEVMEWAAKHALIGVVLSACLPQMLGSFINITYNHLLIVTRMTSAQQQAFAQMLIYYNIIAYPLCVGLLVFAQRRFMSLLLRSGLSSHSCRVISAEERKTALHLPRDVVLAGILGWMPGSVVFPAYIHWATGELGWVVYGNFFVSFLLSATIAVTYSFLLGRLLIFGNLYGKMLLQTSDVEAALAQDPLPDTGTWHMVNYTAGAVPLIALALLLWATPHELELAEWSLFRALLTGLLLMGVCGLIVSLIAAQKTEKVLLLLQTVARNRSLFTRTDSL